MCANTMIRDQAFGIENVEFVPPLQNSKISGSFSISKQTWPLSAGHTPANVVEDTLTTAKGIVQK
jgi:hypothetical protein